MLNNLLIFFSKRYQPRRAMVIVFFSAALWGMLWLPMRHIESYGIDALWVVALFQLMPVFGLLPFITRASFSWNIDLLLTCIAGGSLGIGFVLYGLGLVEGSVTITTVLFYLTPLWSTILGYYFLDEKFGFSRWFAVLLGLFGCILVLRINPFVFNYDKTDLFGLLAGIFWASGSVFVRHYPKLSFFHITFMQYFVGSLFAILLTFLLQRPLPGLQGVWEALPLVFIVSTIILLPAVFLIFRIMQYLSPGVVNILMLSEVLVAAISAWLLLNEVLSVAQWLGVLLILATGLFVGVFEGSEPVD